jgi:predicted tellurium resistance membrane protein TerC
MRRLTTGRTSESSIYRITTARKSVADDQAARVRGYVISMTIRIVCFLLAVVTTGVVRWLFVAGALIIPYVAVVYANSGRERSEAEPDTLRLAPDRELPSGIDRRAS